MSELVKLSDAEDALIREALRDRKAPLSRVVPDDIDAREALAQIKGCVSVLGHLGKASSRVGVYLGKLLAVMKKRPDMLEASGYDSLRKFEEAEISGRLQGGSHGNAWKYKKILEKFHDVDLSLEQIAKAGVTKLEIGAGTLSSNASEKQQREFFDRALKKEPVEEYRKWVEHDSGLSAPGATKTESVELVGPGDRITLLKAFLEHAGSTDWAATTLPLEKVLACVESTASEWDPNGTWMPEPLQTGAVAAPVVVMAAAEELAEDGTPESDPANNWE